MILAIDPGREKCGVAVLGTDGKIVESGIVARAEIKDTVYHYLAKHRITALVVGKSAFGKEVEKELSRLELKTNLIFISEKNSTLEARRRYWKDNKPKGWWKLLPTTMRVPPVPVDDYAAIVLGERYLKS